MALITAAPAAERIRRDRAFRSKCPVRRASRTPEDRPALSFWQAAYTAAPDVAAIEDAAGGKDTKHPPQQRIVSTIYTTLQQYHVILEVDPKFQYGPEAKGIAAEAMEMPAARSIVANRMSASLWVMIFSLYRMLNIVLISGDA
jgi:hypothetical protein